MSLCALAAIVPCFHQNFHWDLILSLAVWPGGEVFKRVFDLKGSILMSLSVSFSRDRIRESAAFQGLRLVTESLGWCWHTTSMNLMYSKHGTYIPHAWCWRTASYACSWDGDRWPSLECQLLLTLMFRPHHSSWPLSSSTSLLLFPSLLERGLSKFLLECGLRKFLQATTRSSCLARST